MFYTIQYFPWLVTTYELYNIILLLHNSDDGILSIETRFHKPHNIINMSKYKSTNILILVTKVLIPYYFVLCIHKHLNIYIYVIYYYHRSLLFFVHVGYVYGVYSNNNNNNNVLSNINYICNDTMQYTSTRGGIFCNLTMSDPKLCESMPISSVTCKTVDVYK